MYGSLKITRRRGGQALSFVAGLIASVGANANPQGAQGVAGTFSLANPNARTLEITNSPAAIINWQSFSIDRGETTRFIQQNAASMVLNRVTSGNSSQILGSLVSNGRVFLINPAGILIGRDGSIDTAGVLLSTLQIKDQDFLNGKMRFAGDGTNADIVNHGYIKTAPGGEVVLIAPRIENSPVSGNSKSGLIESPDGDLMLAAGSKITIASLDDPDVSFDVRAPEHEVVNLGRLLAQGGTASILAGTIRHSGEINADAVTRDAAGHIILSASNHIELNDGSRIHASGGKTADGGKIEITARNAASTGQIDLLGNVTADGVKGGQVTVRGNAILADGLIAARGTSVGGTIDIKSTEATIATVNASMTSGSPDGDGGRIFVDGGKTTFSSATMRATGQTGGSVRILGDDVTLAAGKILAAGAQGGGKVRVGGGFRGGEGLHAADKVQVNESARISANALTAGDGGDVVVWSDGTTRFAGAISARGGVLSGDGGRVEVSGREGLGFNGIVGVSAEHGEAGTLLMDPKNIRFTSAELPGQPIKLLDPHPGSGNQFGARIDFFLANGVETNSRTDASTAVVYDFLDDFGGADAGAVYVYRLSDGALISGLHGLTGSTAGDRVGIVELQTPSAFGSSVHLLQSPQWGGGAGALTLFDTVNGTSGTVSAANSLVGAAAGDNVGSGGFTVLGGGVVGVHSPSFNSGAGALTFVTAKTLKGVVSTGNSLVGVNPGDGVGSRGNLEVLGGGHWLLFSSNGGKGAVTYIDAAAPAKGLIDGTPGTGNSLVGSTISDNVGSGGKLALGGNTVAILSPNVNSGAGAITYINKSTGKFTGTSNAAIGTIDGTAVSGNSLIGANASDGISLSSNDDLGGGHWLMFSANGGKGAVTFIDAAAPVVGTVDSSNSLVGNTSSDNIGGAGRISLGGNTLAILSPQFNSNAGAVTFIDRATGKFSGTPNAAVGFIDDTAVTGNSLVGANASDNVGGNLRNLDGLGHWSMISANGGRGAVTWLNAAAPVVGTVDSSNSLVGGSTTDNVGGGGVVRVSGSTFAIMSPDWDTPLGITNVGAVTVFDAATGQITGTGNAAVGLIDGTPITGNSLVGSTANDAVGSNGFEYMFTGGATDYYAVLSPAWHNTPSVPNAGAITWYTLGGSLIGAVDGTAVTGNSLVGASTGDAVGASLASAPPGGLEFNEADTGIATLNSGKSIYYLPTFGSNAGAVMFLDGSAPPVGTINSSNALIGGTGGDHLGSTGIIERGNYYLVLSPDWTDFNAPNAGAVTIADANTGVSGLVSQLNSLTGDSPAGGDHIGQFIPEDLGFTGNLLLTSLDWHSGTGAVTFIDLANGHLIGDTNFFGVVDQTNSLVGSTIGDGLGQPDVDVFSNGNYLVRASSWSDTSGNGTVGAMTFGSGITGVAGPISSGNSLIGSNTNDRIGDGSLVFLNSGNVLIRSTHWNSDAGAITFLDINTGSFGGSSGVLNGVLAETNSLVGHSANDDVGNATVRQFFAGPHSFYGVFSALADNTNTSTVDSGAVTFGHQDSGISGFVDDNSISFVGTHDDDQFGIGGFDTLNNGNAVLLNKQWNSNAGAATFVDLVNSTGLSGDINSSNSVIGSTGGVDGDQVGSGGIREFTNNVFAVLSPNWSKGGAALNAGAITWANVSTGANGVVGSGNSLLGANADDDVGNGSFIPLIFGGSSSLWYLSTQTFAGGKTALTFFQTGGTLPVGTMGAGNSLIGSTVGDNLGSGGVFVVGSGTGQRVVVESPLWDNGSAVEAGAVTTFLASSPRRGVISAGNSLVGTRANDAVGSSERFFNDGSLAFLSSNWNGTRGAITFWKHTSNLTGNVGASNSLLGANVGDFLGSNFITDLFNGNYIVLSPHGGLGAVTLVTPTANSTGVISASNSLVGTTAGDAVANLGVRPISGNTYGVFSPNWDNGSAVDAGALTMFDISTGTFTGTNTAFRGEINSSNSFIGTFAGDAVGASIRGNPVLILNADGDYAAVFTSTWNSSRGAITWFTPGQQLVGEISATNSLIGSAVNDEVGGGFNPFGSFSVPSGPFGSTNVFNIIATPTWHGNRGAITWLTPGQRLVGRISASNSLVGAFAGDRVGDTSFDLNEGSQLFGMYDLASGNFVLRTDHYNSDAGAITFINPTQGLPTGAIGNGNSFVGRPGDHIGSSGLFVLDGDRVLISSSEASVDGLAGAGRLDLFDGSKKQAVDQIGFGSDAADELAVSIPSVVSFLNGGGKLTLQASNDIFLPQDTNILAKGGALTLEAGRSIEVKGNIVTGGFLRLHANAPGGDADQREAGEGFVSILADSSPTLVKANVLEIEAEDVLVQGGTREGAFAALVGVESARIFAHGSGTVSLIAGTGTNLPPTSSIEILTALLGDAPIIKAPIALILGIKSLDVNAAQLIEMTGGGSTRAFASIASFGELTVAAPDIQLKVGTADNTDAIFLGLGGAGDIQFTTCTGCGDLLSDPGLDNISQTGTFLAGLFQEPATSSILSMLPKKEEKKHDDDEDKSGAEAECH